MQRKLVKVGPSSVALIITKEMLAHLGIEGNTVEVKYTDKGITLTRPLTFEEADAVSKTQFDAAYEQLAQ